MFAVVAEITDLSTETRPPYVEIYDCNISMCQHRPPYGYVLHNYTSNFSKEDGLIFIVKQGSVTLSPVSDEKLNSFYKQLFRLSGSFHRQSQHSLISGFQHQSHRVQSFELRSRKFQHIPQHLKEVSSLKPAHPRLLVHSEERDQHLQEKIQPSQSLIYLLSRTARLPLSLGADGVHAPRRHLHVPWTLLTFSALVCEQSHTPERRRVLNFTAADGLRC